MAFTSKLKGRQVPARGYHPRAVGGISRKSFERFVYLQNWRTGYPAPSYKGRLFHTRGAADTIRCQLLLYLP